MKVLVTGSTGYIGPRTVVTFGHEVPHQRVTAEEMIDLGRQSDQRRAAGKSAPPLSAKGSNSRQRMTENGRDDGEVIRHGAG